MTTRSGEAAGRSETGDARETYTSPELVRHGSVEELTEGGTTPNLQNDGLTQIN